MLRVGLTGGVASGKSTVAAMFARLGAGLIDTDIVAREAVGPGEPGLAAVVEEFGPTILLRNGELDRRALRRIVFEQAERREALEAILHPLIRARTLEQLGALTAPYAIIVVPLLIETGFAELCERILVVDCPEEAQLERLRRRDDLGEPEARAMLAAQIDRRARLARADDVVDNSGTLDSTRDQVEALHTRYLEIAGTAGLPN